MTEPVVEISEARRGRPRPDATIAQDERVLAHMRAAGPLTKTQVAEQLDLTHSKAYLSLYRLRRDGRVARGRGEQSVHIWTVIEGV